MSAMKAVSVQMGFFSSLLGFFDLVKNLYIEMPHSILHKFHQMFHPCWPNNWLIEKCFTATPKHGSEQRKDSESSATKRDKNFQWS